MSGVVVGIDGTPAGRRALRWAAGEASARDAELVVVHVWQFPALAPHVELGEAYAGDLIDRARGGAARLVEHEVADLGAAAAGTRVRRLLLEGDPAASLVAASANADMLVVGTCRDGGPPAPALGSVAQQCVENASCAVVVVR